MDLPDPGGERFSRRRQVALILLLVLALLGAGLGGVVTNPFEPEPSRQPTVEVTPTTPTATPTPGTATATTPGPDTPTTPTPTGSGRDTPTTTPTATVTVTPPAEGDGRDDSASTGGGSGTSGSLSLATVGPTTMLSAGDLAPGDAGSGSVVVRNGGTVDATLRVPTVTVTDHENGIVPAEVGHDGSPNDGELSAHLRLRVRADYADGSSEFLFGTASGPRTLVAIARAGAASGSHELDSGESATVVIVWSVPATAGNDVQSDSVEFDVTIQLRSA